ncbi:MAG: hypothetical protein ABEI27_13320 [Halobellus sp.]|uniref:hypothetical protein n=1 Tax=Halobellus sp. TaxID=1979212 RepID=UPI0035D511D5
MNVFGDAPRVDRGLPFAMPSERSLRLGLYRPGTWDPAHAAPSAARRATVVLVPARDWRAPDRDDLARQTLGHVCAVPEYRGSDAATFHA